MASISNPPLLPFTDGRDKAAKLRDLVLTQVRGSAAEGILFSGGLDTSILATAVAAHGRRLRAIMVSVDGGPGLDEPFAALMAAQLGLQLEVLRPSLDQLL